LVTDTGALILEVVKDRIISHYITLILQIMYNLILVFKFILILYNVLNCKSTTVAVSRRYWSEQMV